jgi:uncharacterized membrane protein
MSEPGAPSPAVPPSAATPPQGPRSFGQVLDRVFQILRANKGLFLAIAAPPAILVFAFYVVLFAALWSIVGSGHPPNAAEITSKAVVTGAAFFAFSVLIYLVFALYEPAAVYAALQANAGAKPKFGEAYGMALGKAARFVWLAILRCLIVAGPILVFAAIVGTCVGLAFAKSQGNFSPDKMLSWLPLLMLLYFGSLIYAIVAFLWLALACPACVAENVPATAAIGRSFKLTRGAKGRIFLLLLVLYAIYYATVIVVECVFAALGSAGALVFMLLHVALKPWGLVAIGVGAFCLLVAIFVLVAYVWSSFMTTFAVVYHEQRMRREGAVAAEAPAS